MKSTEWSISIWSPRHDKFCFSGPQQRDCTSECTWASRAGMMKIHSDASEACQDPPASVYVTLTTRLSSQDCLLWQQKSMDCPMIKFDRSMSAFQRKRRTERGTYNQDGKENRRKTHAAKWDEKGGQPETPPKQEAERAVESERDMGRGLKKKEQKVDKTLHQAFICSNKQLTLKRRQLPINV